MDCFPTKMHIWITPWGITKWHGIPRPMDPRLISYAQITQISFLVCYVALRKVISIPFYCINVPLMY